METSIDGVYELQALFQFAPVTTLPTLPYAGTVFERRFVEACLLRSHDNKTTTYSLLLHLCIQFYQVYLLEYHFVNNVLLRAVML